MRYTDCSRINMIITTMIYFVIIYLQVNNNIINSFVSYEQSYISNNCCVYSPSTDSRDMQIKQRMQRFCSIIVITQGKVLFIHIFFI